MSDEQRIVCFSGNVQGVGFRYTACRIAARYSVVGYVRNLPDGRVECVVEGEEAEIDSFIEDLAQAMYPHVRGQTKRSAPYTGKYKSFDVKF